MERYIGLDVHSASCTAGVLSSTGKRLKSQVLETNGKVLVDFIRTIPGNRHLCIEEGTQANWLYELLRPHVDELVVIGVPKSKGPKSDKIDSFSLAEKLRINSIETRVYKGRGEFEALRAFCNAYTTVMKDSVRVQNRLKFLFRARCISTEGQNVYLASSREKWLRTLPPTIRPLAETYYLEHDSLMEIRKKALREMLREAKKHPIYRTLVSCPGLGPIRVAQVLAIVVTPYRFSNKRVFWSYIGLGIVMRSTSDWIRAADGSWIKANTQQTRGLNRNHNRVLKHIFKGAATTVIGQAKNEPLYRHYQELLKNGTKPNLAKLTIARQIASIALSMWRSQEEYDTEKLKK